MKTKLKPCPFCGEPERLELFCRSQYAGLYYDSAIKCLACCAKGSTYSNLNKENAVNYAIEAWNTRVSLGEAEKLNKACAWAGVNPPQDNLDEKIIELELIIDSKN